MIYDVNDTSKPIQISTVMRPINAIITNNQFACGSIHLHKYPKIPLLSQFY